MKCSIILHFIYKLHFILVLTVCKSTHLYNGYITFLFHHHSGPDHYDMYLSNNKFIDIHCTFQLENNKGADQTALMCRLVCIFVVHISPQTGFLMR